MRKILLLFITVIYAFAGIAQTSDADKSAAFQLVNANRVALGLSTDDLNNTAVSSSYVDRTSGIRYVYLIQTYLGIPVYNQMQVLSFRGNQLLSKAGDRVFGIDQKADVPSGIPVVSAESAVMAAIADRKLSTNQTPLVLDRKDNGQKLVFGNLGVSRENITAQLMWVPSNEGKTINLGWQVYIIPTTTPDYWLVRVSASNSSTLAVQNLTVYCSWDDPKHVFEFGKNHIHAKEAANNSLTTKNLFDFKKIAKAPVGTSPSLADNANYRVIPLPYEAPSFMPAAPSSAVRSNPWLAATANAITLKWHSTDAAGTDFNYTRGNDTWAYQDRTPQNNTGTQAKSATSTTPLPNLSFDFLPDYTQEPTVTTPPNQQFNITNLFYWNNVMHDVMYAYGFDEPAANFQDNNLGRGGVGNDHVNAEAQDGGGTNNANFATPGDGGSGRMQMYLFTAPNPDRDGDVDNGVICHEWGHGISNRLTGGPAGGAGCLGNAEQMGEGWGDIQALMFTQDWANSVLTTGFTNPRGMGTYVLAQATNGLGIRSQKYSTDFSINNKVYAASIPAEPHDRGEIWCAVLWDMVWNVINNVGTINPNIYDLAGGGGNNIAWKLIVEGMKLQPCSPGFISGRDGIIQADINLYGGAHLCAIKEAFRRRGMGDGASQGSSASVTDQIPSFVLFPSVTLTQGGVTHVPEGQNINYVNTVTSACAAVAGFTLRDTIPANVTPVLPIPNGGSWDAVNRVVSWPINQAQGSTQTYNFAVTINAGAYFPPVTYLNEPVPAAMPATWTPVTTVPAGGILWVVSTTESHSAPNSFFSLNEVISTDKRLELTTAIAIPAATAPSLSFWHRYNSEPGWDGGVVEISTNGGGTWTDLGPFMTLNGYNGSLGAGVGNNLANRNAFTGSIPAFINTTVDLTSFAGQSIKIRFRFASDDNTAGTGTPTGWFVDDINITNTAVVKMRSSLFNAANVRVSFVDTITIIDPPVGGCVPQTITSQPVSTAVCNNTNASFSVTANGFPAPTYQWQLSTTGAGGPWNNVPVGAPYSGQTTATLNITPATVAMNGYQYRLVLSGCAANVTSSPAVLTVVAASVGGTVNPPSTNVCGAVNTGTLTLSGNVGNVVRWEFSTVGAGGPFNPTVPANTTTTYTYTNLTQTTWFRAVVQATGCAAVNSSVAVVTFAAAAPIIITSDVGTTICQGDPALLTAVVGPTLTTFTNPAAITINAVGAATPYPSNIVASGLPTSGVNVLSVTLTGVNHTWASDVDVVLQSPTNQNVILMSDVGGNVAFPANANYTFSDAAAANMAAAANASGTYKPTNLVGTLGVEPDSWPAPGPLAVTQPNPALSLFNGDFNGTWKLYVVDDAAGDGGSINGGWSIIFSVPGGPITGGTFLWAPAAGLNATNINPVAASPASTTTYTVTHNNGAGCIRQASITLTVNSRPIVTSSPVSRTNCAGTSATFTVAGTGTGLTYQWQVSTAGAGGPWVNLADGTPYSGTSTATLTINPVATSMTGYAYRAILGGACPPGIPALNVSAAAILTVNALPVVTISPTGPVCGGVAGTNGTALTASGANTYVWSPIAGLYTNATATTAYTGTNLATVYAAPTVNTVYTVTGTSTGTGCSNTATISVTYTPTTPLVLPAFVAMCAGDAAVLLAIQGTPNNGIWTPATGLYTNAAATIPYVAGTPASQVYVRPGTTTTYSVTVSSIGPDAFQTFTNPAVITINAVGAATPYPSNIVAAGLPTTGVSVNTVTLTGVNHTWASDVDVLLQSPTGQNVILMSDVGGNGSFPANANYTFSDAGVAMAAAPNATGTYKPTNLVGTIGVEPDSWPAPGPLVVNQPAPALSLFTGDPNGTWKLYVVDDAAGDQGSINGGYSIQFKWATPGCTSAARQIVVTVNTPTTITVQPVSTTICTDKVATFTVAASGTGPFTYQWQVSTTGVGGPWIPLSNGGVYSGVNTATLTITAPPTSMSGYLYRVIVQGASPCAAQTSNAATLTVNPLPTVVITATQPTALFPGLTSTLSSTVTPFPVTTYQWLRNGIPVSPGGNTGTYVVDVDHLGDYTLRVTDVNGCINTSNLITIRDSATGTLFIYPNPNSGLFQMRYFSASNNVLPRGLTVYNAKGARVLVQNFTINAPYARMDIDLRRFGKGVYWLELSDNSGNRIAVGRAVVQ